MGRTFQRLHNRIAQPIPKSTETKPNPQESCQHINKTKILTIHSWNSVTELHLLQNDESAKFYNDQQFSILGKAQTPFHLAALEATYITIHQLVLCHHKEFVCALQIPH